ncbi:2020_t:CDS:2 [Diversispora eburnea]|uniref:2020_t:CDS:1 n=1 Tax=Diversispora eburnea TaxID=1213867 RepID=A0A9N9AIA8_9GLOM|nr:2020_t:CDS:2 [Diversispora eburnea]
MCLKYKTGFEQMAVNSIFLCLRKWIDDHINSNDNKAAGKRKCEHINESMCAIQNLNISRGRQTMEEAKKSHKSSNDLRDPNIYL